MENILLIYRGEHASQRVVNATMHQYENSVGAKQKFNLFAYCIGKKSQTRLDRFIDKFKIDVIYIHKELIKNEVSKYIHSGVKVLEYTRTDFTKVENYYHGYRGRYYGASITYTLLEELINNEKEKHGKIKLYHVGYNHLVEELEIYRVDLSTYYNRGNYFLDLEHAIVFLKKEKLLYLEREKQQLQITIENANNRLKVVTKELDKLKKESK